MTVLWPVTPIVVAHHWSSDLSRAGEVALTWLTRLATLSIVTALPTRAAAPAVATVVGGAGGWALRSLVGLRRHTGSGSPVGRLP